MDQLGLIGELVGNMTKDEVEMAVKNPKRIKSPAVNNVISRNGFCCYCVSLVFICAVLIAASLSLVMFWVM